MKHIFRFLHPSAEQVRAREILVSEYPELGRFNRFRLNLTYLARSLIEMLLSAAWILLAYLLWEFQPQLGVSWEGQAVLIASLLATAPALGRFAVGFIYLLRAPFADYDWAGYLRMHHIGSRLEDKPAAN